MKFQATYKSGTVTVSEDQIFKGRWCFDFFWSDGSQGFNDTAVWNNNLTLRSAKAQAMGRLLYQTGYWQRPVPPKPRFKRVED